jgi:hypothetical protein
MVRQDEASINSGSMLFIKDGPNPRAKGWALVKDGPNPRAGRIPRVKGHST